MISSGIGLPNVVEIIAILERGIPTNQPLEWNDRGILKTVQFLQRISYFA